MKKHFERVECPDEEIYLSEDSGFYDLYLKNKYFDENQYVNAKPQKVVVKYEDIKDKLPKPYWEGHQDNIDAYYYAWQLAFKHIHHPTEENGFIRSYIDTAFNGNTFMGDSAAMMSFTKYAKHLFDFTGTLENFYSKQHIDGFICREIRGDNGKDRFHRFDPISCGVHWFGLTEWALYEIFGDKERIKKVFPVLMGYHQWLNKYRTNPDGSYWSTGLGSTADNQPRVPQGASMRLDVAHQSWNDINLIMILDCEALIGMSKVLGREEETKDLVKEKDFLLSYVLKNQWNDKEKFFFSTRRDGSFDTCKTALVFWALHIESMPKEIIQELVKHLMNKEEFNRFNPFPSISADSPMYDPNGLYWRGGVWSCIETMIFKGLVKQGYTYEAFDTAYRHNDAVVKEFVRDHTLWEDYAPDSLDVSIPSLPEMVGWTGNSVISTLLEYIFGLMPSHKDNRIVWNINLLDEFGVDNYYLNGQYLSLHCDKRKSRDEKPIIHVSGGHFELEIHYGDKVEVLQY